MYKGDIKNFPEEIVERMLECQEKQGNKIDISIFENYRASSSSHGGFTWDRTKERASFWNSVIRFENFKIFFEYYPKKEKEIELLLLI